MAKESNGSFDLGPASRLVSCRLLRRCAFGRPNVVRKSYFLACGNKTKAAAARLLSVTNLGQQKFRLRAPSSAFLVAPIVL